MVRPGSKLATGTWWADTTLGADLGVADASTDEIYAAMDWLVGRQDAIEARLARRHLAAAANPARMALFDLSSSWLEGRCCRWPPAATPATARKAAADRVRAAHRPRRPPGRGPGLPREHRRPGRVHRHRPVVREEFGLAQIVMVGDRGMITSARIAALNRLEDGTARPDPYGWITALRAPAIKKLMAEDGPL